MSFVKRWMLPAEHFTIIFSAAQTTVYETAQSKNTIGFLNGSYLASLDNGVLSVTYTVEESYASDDGQTLHENVYRFDTATGEQLDA